jgi:hypothetical protein
VDTKEIRNDLDMPVFFSFEGWPHDFCLAETVARFFEERQQNLTLTIC